MRSHKFWTSTFAGTVAMPVLIGLLGGPAVAASMSANGGDIIVKRADKVTKGTGWDVTIPASDAGHVFDKVWLVIDRKREGFGGGYFPYWDKTRTARLYANISNDLDGQVKDILKAQGFPVKANVTVYRLSYGVNSPNRQTVSKSLRFRHEAYLLDYSPNTYILPSRYKIGDMITIFDALMLDDDTISMHVFNNESPFHHIRSGLPTDLVHEIKIQVQFVRTGPDHMPLPAPSAAQ